MTTYEARKAACKTSDDVFTLLENSTPEYRQWFYDNFTKEDMTKFLPDNKSYWKFIGLMVDYDIH